MPKNHFFPRTVALVQSIAIDGRRYQERMTRCGKSNCSRCYHLNRSFYGHGPYWYMMVKIDRSWRRVYIGKILDTTKFVDADGRPDLSAIAAARAPLLS